MPPLASDTSLNATSRRRSRREGRGGRGRPGPVPTWKGLMSTGSANGLVSKPDMGAVPAAPLRAAAAPGTSGAAAAPAPPAT